MTSSPRSRILSRASSSEEREVAGLRATSGPAAASVANDDLALEMFSIMILLLQKLLSELIDT